MLHCGHVSSAQPSVRGCLLNCTELVTESTGYLISLRQELQLDQAIASSYWSKRDPNIPYDAIDRLESDHSTPYVQYKVVEDDAGRSKKVVHDIIFFHHTCRRNILE